MSRYSNTFLVSLNSRINIHYSDISPYREASLATRPAPTAKDGPSIVYSEIEKTLAPCVLEERKQSGESSEPEEYGRDWVIGKCFSTSCLPHVSFNIWDLINRYRMIRIPNGWTSGITITTTGSIIYFCAVTFHLMDILFNRRGKPLLVVERKLSWCSLTVRRVRPVVQIYTRVLKSDTVNRSTAHKN